MKFLRTPFLHSTASIVWEVEISSLCFLALINEPVFVSSHFVAQKLLFTKFVFFYANFIQVTTQYSFYCRQILKSKKNKNKKKKNLSRITFEFFKLISVFQRKTKQRCCQRLSFVLFDVSQLSRHVPNCNGKNETYKSQTLNVIVNRLGKHLHPENILLIE